MKVKLTPLQRRVLARSLRWDLQCEKCGEFVGLNATVNSDPLSLTLCQCCKSGIDCGKPDCKSCGKPATARPGGTLSNTPAPRITAKDVADVAKGLQSWSAPFVIGVDPAGPAPQHDVGTSEPTPTCGEHPGDYGTNCRACEEDLRRYREWKSRRAEEQI